MLLRHRGIRQLASTKTVARGMGARVRTLGPSTVVVASSQHLRLQRQRKLQRAVVCNRRLSTTTPTAAGNTSSKQAKPKHHQANHNNWYAENTVPAGGHGAWIGGVYGFGEVLSAALFVMRLVGLRSWGTSLLDRQSAGIERRLEKLCNDSELRLLKVIPCPREGGCLVFFKERAHLHKLLHSHAHAWGDQNEEDACSEIHPKENLWIYPLYGQPYVEDILTHKPSVMLMLQFDSINSHTEEDVFLLCRRFGRVQDIKVDEKLKQVMVTFVSKQSAIAARNCIHSLNTNSVPEEFLQHGHISEAFFSHLTSDLGRITVRYHDFSRWRTIREAARNPRLIPLWALLLVAAIVILVTPLRSVNVTKTLAIAWQEDLAHALRFPLKEAKKETAQEQQEEQGRAQAEEKQDEQQEPAASSTYPPRSSTVLSVEDAQAWLEEYLASPPSGGGIVVITGPKGTGKTAMLQSLLHGRRFSLRVDCDATRPQNQKDATVTFDQETTASTLISRLETAIGFSPSFRALNTVIGWIESMLPTKGTEGLSYSTSSQLESILSTLDLALRTVSLSFPDRGGVLRRRQQAQQQQQLQQQQQQSGKGAAELSNSGNSSSAGNNGNRKASSSSFPYSVVVFDHFHKAMAASSGDDKKRSTSEEGPALAGAIIAWSAAVSQVHRTAHVVLVSDNTDVLRSLQKHPQAHATVQHIEVSDLPLARAEEYVRHHLTRIEAARHGEDARPSGSSGSSSSSSSSGGAAAGVADTSAGATEERDSLSTWTILKRVRQFSVAGLTGGRMGQDESSGAAASSLSDLRSGGVENNNISSASRLQPARDAKAIVAVLGGRLADLSLCLERMSVSKSHSVHQVLRSMVDDAREDVLAAAFGEKLFKDEVKARSARQTTPPWTQKQMWKMMQALNVSFERGNMSTLGDDSVSAAVPAAASHAIFKGSTNTTDMLVDHNLLRFVSLPEHGQVLCAASPLKQQAFRSLVQDASFFKPMQKYALESDIEDAKGKLRLLEEELHKLGEISQSRFGNLQAQRFTEARLETLSTEMDRHNKELAKLMKKLQEL